MTIVEIANKVLSLGTIGAQIAIVLALVYLIFFRTQRFSLVEFIEKHGLLLAWLVALVSMLGSLFYSNVAGFPPCDLCWVQRIFMYPLVIVLGIALFNNNKWLIRYSFVSVAIGALVSLYHNYMYYADNGLNVFCQLGGMQISCVKRYVFEFGYVTIPLMALTAFALIIIFLVFHVRKGRNNIV
jgi:disulfide bond formation protein DsbB